MTEPTIPASPARALLDAVDRMAQAEASAARNQGGVMHPSTRAALLGQVNTARRDLRTTLEAHGA